MYIISIVHSINYYWDGFNWTPDIKSSKQFHIREIALEEAKKNNLIGYMISLWEPSEENKGKKASQGGVRVDSVTRRPDLKEKIPNTV